MSPVGVRDWFPAAWLLACEFTRPTRASRRWLPAAILSMPLWLFVASLPGTFHRDRRAILNVRRQRTGRARIALSIVGFAVGLALLDGVAGTWWAVALVVVAFVAVAVPRAWGGWTTSQSRPRRAGRHFSSWRSNPPDATWVIGVASAAPTTTNAIENVLMPFVRTLVASGETVGAVAANRRLADVYRGLGFHQVGENPYELRFDA